MKRTIQIIRYLFAIFFIASGLGYFAGFMPLPPMTGMAKQLIDAMVASGYFMGFVKITELAAGLLLLCNFLAPLALAILAPVLINILLFNFVLNPSAIVMSIVIFIIYLVLVWSYREKFSVVFRSDSGTSVNF